MAAKKPTGNFDLENSLSHLLRRAQQFAYDQFVQQMGSSSITPRQFIVLFAVNEEEGLSQTDRGRCPCGTGLLVSGEIIVVCIRGVCVAVRRVAIYHHMHPHTPHMQGAHAEKRG